MSDNQTVLITGTNRGFGLELVRQYLSKGSKVIAGSRKPDSRELKSLQESSDDQLTVLDLDISSRGSIRIAFEKAADYGGLDILINNAGVLHRDETIKAWDDEQVLEAFKVNSVGPMLMVKEFLPLLRKSKHARIANISSGSGSLTSVRGFNGLYGYKASKAALNMLTRVLAFELEEEDMVAVSLDPGWMKTDMGGPEATGSVQESAQRMIKLIDSLTTADSGKFLACDGSICEW